MFKFRRSLFYVLLCCGLLVVGASAQEFEVPEGLLDAPGKAALEAVLEQVRDIMKQEKETPDRPEAERYATTKEGRSYLIEKGGDGRWRASVNLLESGGENYTLNLLKELKGSPKSPDGVIRNVEAQVDFTLKIMLSDRAPRLTVSDTGDFYVTFNDSNVPKRLIRVNSTRGPPSAPVKYVAEYTDSLFVEVKPDFSPEILFQNLESTPFDRTQIRIASLIPDSKLEGVKGLKRPTLNNVVVSLVAPTEEGLSKLFAENPHTVVHLLTHVQGDSAVVPGLNGEEAFRIGLDKLNAMAKAQKCDLILLGCEAGKCALPIGPLEPINPLEAVNRLEDALGAKNWADFAQRLSSKDMNLVFGTDAFAETLSRVEPDVYAKKADGAGPDFQESNRVARRIIFSLGTVALPSPRGSGGLDGGKRDKAGAGVAGSERPDLAVANSGIARNAQINGAEWTLAFLPPVVVGAGLIFLVVRRRRHRR
jgi:hypothetical protein